MSNIRNIAATSSHRQAATSGISVIFNGILAQIGAWRERSRERRQLGALPPHLLKDLGIDPADAQREASKPFWRA